MPPKTALWKFLWREVRSWTLGSALLDPPFPGAVRTLLVTSGWCLPPARHPQGVRLTLAMLPPSALAAGTEGGVPGLW